MKIVKYDYFEYKVTTYMDIKNMSDTEVKTLILDKAIEINKNGGYNLAYGIFDYSKSFQEIREILDNTVFTISEIDGEPRALGYQYFLENNLNLKILHQGLVLSTKNPGRNITFMHIISSELVFLKYGLIYTTNLATDPLFVGEFSKLYFNSWPNPYADNRFPPEKIYKFIAEACFNEYVLKFFPFPESLSFDDKRFVLKTKAQEMGFETDMRKMLRHQDTLVNLFCMYWLNYEKQEIMLQIGQINSSKLAEIKTFFKIKNMEIL